MQALRSIASGIRASLVNLTNRKFLAPFFALAASLIVGQPDFPMSASDVDKLLRWIWAAGLGIPFADALYDQAQNAIAFRKAGFNG